MSVALVIQHAMRMRLIAICGLSGSTTFFSHYLIMDPIPPPKKNFFVFIFIQLLSEIFLI
jgi:hypothetical protein